MEVGSVTPKPQPGNPKPRLFRLIEDKGLINRFGFNSLGVPFMREMLSIWRKNHPKSDPNVGLLGVNLGKNKDSKDPIGDFLYGMTELGEFADYLVINISSPNTPGLRDLQAAEQMDHLLTDIQTAKKRNINVRNVPLFVKISPDLTSELLKDVIRVGLKHDITGYIVSNSTIERPSSLISPHKMEKGGLSGRPLKEKSLQLLKDIHAATGGKVKLISVGGVETGDDVLERLKAGASLVQVYSALTFEGPGLISRINDRLFNLLRAEGTTVNEVVKKAANQNYPSSHL